MKPNSLKALAKAVLQRNIQHNKNATGQKKACNIHTNEAYLLFNSIFSMTGSI